MRVEDICRHLSQGDAYSTRLEDGVLVIKDLEIGSEYVLEMFEPSAQVRQAIWFDLSELSGEELSRVYVLCSMMNARFSGCKCFIDQWGALITGTDILSQAFDVDFLEIVLGQVEFVSQATLDLMEILRIEQRLVTEEEIDSALYVPPLH
jgi:hypothetical protein